MVARMLEGKWIENDRPTIVIAMVLYKYAIHNIRWQNKGWMIAGGKDTDLFNPNRVFDQCIT